VYDVALDNYVLNRQCRCADQKMLNDSPTPEEPTNLCQPSNVMEAAPTPIMTMPPCEEEDHDHEHEHEESMKYRIDKASSGAASAELGMPAYEACSPKMDYDTQDELPDSPHSQPLPPPPLPPNRTSTTCHCRSDPTRAPRTTPTNMCPTLSPPPRPWG